MDRGQEKILVGLLGRRSFPLACFLRALQLYIFHVPATQVISSMKLNSMSTLQEKEYFVKQQTSEVLLKHQITWILISVENNQSFYSIADVDLSFPLLVLLLFLPLLVT